MAFTPTGVEFLAKGFNKYLSDLGRADKAQQGLGKSVEGIAGSFTKTGNAILGVGALAGGAALAGVLALGAGITAVATSGVQKAADLDQKMADIAATMNITKDAAAPLKQLIFDLALDPNLKVNATEAADAIQLLAQNGATADQILGGLAASTVALANATGGNFAVSADIASGVMNVFGLKASEVAVAIDGITGVTNQSKFTIDDYGLAFAQAGGIAAGMGVTLGDFNTVIAATATSFNSGEDAGTSFKTFLQRLANPTDEMNGLMQDLGISLFDSAGNMRDMKDVVGQLHGAFAGMTEAEKAEAAAKLGGADAARTVLALSKLTTNEFDRLSGSVNQQGQAFRAAATRVDSFRGAMDIFRGVIEAVHIQIGDRFLPLLRRLAVGFTSLASRHGPQVVAAFGNIADRITGLIDFGVRLADAFGEHGLAGVFAALGFGGSALFLKKLTELLEMMGLTEGGATSLGETILNTIGVSFDWLANNLFPMLSQGIQFIMDHFEEFKGALVGIGAVLGGSVFAALAVGLLSLLTPINLIIAGVALLVAAWAVNWGNIQGITFQAIAVILTAWTVLQGIFNGIATAFQPAIEKIGQAFSNLGITWTDVGNALLTATGIVFAGIGAIILVAISIIVGLVGAVASAVATMVSTWSMFIGFFAQGIAGIILFITSIRDFWIAVFAGDLPGALQAVHAGLTGLLVGVVGFVASFISLIVGLAATVISLFTGLITSLVGFWQGFFDTMVGGSIIPDLVEGIIDWFTILSDDLLAIMDALVAGVESTWQGLTDWLVSSWQSAWDSIKSIVEGAIGGIIDIISGLMDDVQGLIDAISSIGSIELPSFSGGLGFKHGIGLQAGTLGLGMTVPGQGRGDTFGPLFLEPGEEILVTPRGQTIEGVLLDRLSSLIGGGGDDRSTTINMPIYTTEQPQAIIRQVQVLKALIG